MKKQLSRMMIFAAIVACVLFSASAFAQQVKHTPEEKAKRITDSLKTNLSLTDDQYTKIYDLNLAYVNKVKALRQQDGSKEDKKGDFKDLHKSHSKDLSDILTSDQLAKFKSMQKEKREEKKKHHDASQS